MSNWKPVLLIVSASSLGACMTMEDGDSAPTQAAASTGVVTVGGAPMYANKNIIENAINSKDHTTLVAAVQAAGLVDTLQGEGPFTVFAPTNAAFEKLPAGTVDKLLQPDRKDQLTGVLTYHVVPGRLTAQDLMAKAKDMGGTFNMQTAAGGTLTARVNGDKLVVIDESGGGATVTIPDVLQSNGVIHVVDTVLMPKM